MKLQKASAMIKIGIPILLIGFIFYYISSSFSEENLEIARNAKSAFEAAQAISSNNQKELFFHMIGMFCMGMGGVLTAVGGIRYFQEKK